MPHPALGLLPSRIGSPARSVRLWCQTPFSRGRLGTFAQASIWPGSGSGQSPYVLHMGWPPGPSSLGQAGESLDGAMETETEGQRKTAAFARYCACTEYGSDVVCVRKCAQSSGRKQQSTVLGLNPARARRLPAWPVCGRCYFVFDRFRFKSSSIIPCLYRGCGVVSGCY